MLLKQRLPAKPRPLVLQIVIAALALFIVNTARRLTYAFAPAISQGLQVSLGAITSLIALNQATGLLSLIAGPYSDRIGYRTVMLTSLAMLGVGLVAVGLLPFYGVLLVMMFLSGVGKVVYGPALQAYIGANVPYNRRGLTIGLVEYSWAGAALIGLPLVGLMIDGYGWQSPFLLLGGGVFILLIALIVVIPVDPRPTRQPTPQNTLLTAWNRVRTHPVAVGILSFNALASCANDLLFVVYALWLTEHFGLTVVALGFATTVIGLAELVGETLTASFADRLGLRRALVGGALLSAIAYAALPLVGQTLPLALVGLFCTFLMFEFTIVSQISFASEVLPEARATMLSCATAAGGMGRVVGASAGSTIWLFGQTMGWGGITAIGLVAAALNLLAIITLLRGLSPKHCTTV